MISALGYQPFWLGIVSFFAGINKYSNEFVIPHPSFLLLKTSKMRYHKSRKHYCQRRTMSDDI